MPIVTPSDVNSRISIDLHSKQLQVDLMSAQDKMTALAGGGQTGATLVSNVYNRFTTVATAGDSAMAPVAQVGMWLNIINSTANSMNVFPSVGGFINAGAVNVQLAVPAAKTATFFCANAGQWHASIGA